MPIRRLLSTATGVVDDVVLQAVGARARPDNPEARALWRKRRLERVARALEAYRDFDAGDPFRPARAIEPAVERVRMARGGGDVLDLRWDSDPATHLPEIGPRYRWDANDRAAARVFDGPAARGPAVVLIHGYGGGHYPLEERVWPLRRLRRLGLTPVLFVLPFHGVRRPVEHTTPRFPSSDPRMTNEGFLQAVGDLRDLVGWLLARGHSAVGVMGMSLGGYTTALAATVDDRLAFAVPIIPLASLADWARDRGEIEPDDSDLYNRIAGAHALTSPLERAPLLPPSRVRIVAARGDRVTPVAHAQRLAKHFRAPLEVFPGGHLLQLGRGRALRASVEPMLASLGLIGGRR
jgi:dienelactone hydrolase